MKLGEKFNLPIITLIDTAGAYPVSVAEERNQSEAIAGICSNCRGCDAGAGAGDRRGGSGGALAIGVGDYSIMLSTALFGDLAGRLRVDPVQESDRARMPPRRCASPRRICSNSSWSTSSLRTARRCASRSGGDAGVGEKLRLVATRAPLPHPDDQAA